MLDTETFREQLRGFRSRAHLEFLLCPFTLTTVLLEPSHTVNLKKGKRG